MGKLICSALLLGVLMALNSALPAWAFVQDDPLGQCKKGETLFREGKPDEALPLLEAGFAAREGAAFADPEALGHCALLLGVLRHRAGDLTGSLETQQVALKIFRASGNRHIEQGTLHNIGWIYQQLGQDEEALDYFQQELKLVQALHNPEKEGELLLLIGSIYENSGLYQEALGYYRPSLTILQKIGDRAGEGVTLNLIGLIYARLSQYSLALDYYEQSLKLSQELDDQKSEASTLSNMGGAYSELSQYEQALEAYQQALTLQQALGERQDEGITLNGLGNVYRAQGDYETALDYYQRSLKLRQEMGDRAGEAITLDNLGGIYADQGQYELALEHHQRTLQLRQTLGNHFDEARSLVNLGFVYGRLGQYEQALSYYQQALTLWQKFGHRSGEGDALNNIGAMYDYLGRSELALSYYRRSLRIWQELGDRAGEGTALNNIGFTLDTLGQAEQALTYFQRSLAIRQEIGDIKGEATNLINIGLIKLKQGQQKAALEDFQRSLAIRQKLGDRAGEAESFNSLGEVYGSMGRYEQALAYYRRGLNIQQEIGNPFGEITSLLNMGEVYLLLKAYEQALDHFQRSLKLSQDSGDLFNEVALLTKIGTVYQLQGQADQALDYYEQAMTALEGLRAQAGSDQQRASFISQYTSLYRNVVELFQQQGQQAQAFYTVERNRARAFLDSLATGQVRLSDKETTDLLAEEQSLYVQYQTSRLALAEIQATNAPDPAQVAKLAKQLAEAEAAYIKIQTEIRADQDQLADLIPSRSQNVLEVSQVQSLLDEKTTLIAYYVLKDKTLAFLLTKNNFQIVPLEISRAQLDTEITAFRDFSTVDTAYPAQAVTLYRWLIEPLKAHLKTAHLVIVPHSILHYLPFAGLTDGKHYLIDDYSLTTLPSASSLPFIQKNAQQTTYAGQPIPLILGNPVTGDYDATASLVVDQTQYRNQLGPLPYAEKEAQAIADLFGVQALVGQAASESEVRAQGSQANLLHLAAHGKFNPTSPLNSLIALAPDPSESGTCLAKTHDSPEPVECIELSQSGDGWLTVGEVYGLDLKKTNLVVLSACETNLGDLSEGDELVGLTRAFIFAGTPSVMATLWSVEDAVTAQLMERFYTHLQEGLSKAEALRQAQLEVREQYPNPYYWAAFVLSGDPGGP